MLTSLVRDVAEHLAISATASFTPAARRTARSSVTSPSNPAVSVTAFAAAVPATWPLPYPAASGIIVVGLVYVALVAVVCWWHYGPLSPGTLRSLVPGGSGVNKRDGS